MQICGLEAVIRRRPKKYRKVKPDYVAENVLARKFTAEKPNQKWCTDVTEFKYGNGKKAYLSAIIDLYDKSIVSYVLGHSNNNDLVFKTIRPAIRQLVRLKEMLRRVLLVQARVQKQRMIPKAAQTRRLTI